MSSFSIQFHATPDEIAKFVQDWVSTYDVNVIAVEYHPYRAWQVAKDDLATEVMRPPVRRIVFTESAPVLPASGNLDLIDNNPGALILELGRLGPNGLCESALSTMQASAAWSGVARRLKKATTTGATVTNEATGAAGPARGYRYTAGARELERQGVKMRTLTGILVRLDA